MKRATRWSVVASTLALLLCACAVVADHTDETSLRERYARETRDVSRSSLYWSVIARTVGAGVVLNAIPGFHIIGAVIDLGVVVDSFDRMIYGIGAIVARERSCSRLVGDGDFFGASGAWFRGVRSAPELDAMLGFASVMVPMASQQEAAEAFATAATRHGLPILGPKLSGILMGKVGIKSLTGFMPVLGPLIAGGINWFIFDRLNDAALAYYEDKADHICKAPTKSL